MRIVVIILLLVGAHYSLTPFAPAPGKAWLGWPFDADSKPWLGGVDGVPGQPGSLVTTLLAAVAGLGFLAAAISLIFGAVVPVDWWQPLVVVAAVASALLYVLYFGMWALIPLVVDAVLLWGVLAQGWSRTL